MFIPEDDEVDEQSNKDVTQSNDDVVEHRVMIKDILPVTPSTLPSQQVL